MAPAQEIELNNSDGVDEFYPTNTTKHVNADGSYEYYKPLGPESTRYKTYCANTAQAIVRACLPDEDSSVPHVLKKLPDGYAPFEHTKSQPKGDKDRTDCYLYGLPTGKRFRSVREFEPHAIWLAANDETLDVPDDIREENQECKCRYCGMAPQGNSKGSAKKKVQADQQAIENKAWSDAEEAERVAEEDLSGWVFRRGEICWMWLPEEDKSADPDSFGRDESYFKEGEKGQWVAVIIRDRPDENTRQPWNPIHITGPFSMEAADDPSPKYEVQILGVYKWVNQKIPQHRLRPWVARPEYIPKKTNEHFSVSYARKKQDTFQFFEEIYYPNQPKDWPTSNGFPIDPDGYEVHCFGGIFLGAEKILLGDPVRIAGPNPEDPEDVLVVRLITIGLGGGTLGWKKSCQCWITGDVYTTTPGPGTTKITPQQYAALPYRMRLGHDAEGNDLWWHCRNDGVEEGQVSIACLLGRWYEPQLVKHYLQFSSQNKLAQVKLKRFITHRTAELGVFETPYFAEPHREGTPLEGGGLASEKEWDQNRYHTPEPPLDPETGFKSVNMPVRTTPAKKAGVTPGSASKSGMARAVEEDEEEEEEEEYGDDDVILEDAFGKSNKHRYELSDDEDDLDVLAKSPTKRLRLG